MDATTITHNVDSAMCTHTITMQNFNKHTSIHQGENKSFELIEI